MQEMFFIRIFPSHNGLDCVQPTVNKTEILSPPETLIGTEPGCSGKELLWQL